MLRRRTTITRAKALEFQVPSDTRERSNRSVHNTLIVLDAAGGSDRVQGLGEAPRRERADTGDSETGSWRFLKAALESVHGRQFPARKGAASAFVAETFEDLRLLADDMSSARQPELPYRGMLTGLDSAIVDLVARTANVPFRGLLGQQHRRDLNDVFIVRSATQSSELGSDGRACGVVKLDGLEDREAALGALRQAVNQAGDGQPFWLDLQGRLDQAEALKLVEAMSDMINGGEIAPHIVLHRPLDAAEHAGLGELQAAADSGVRPGRDRPGIVVMADVRSTSDALSLTAKGTRGLNVNLQRVGGSLAAIDIVRQLAHVSGQLHVALSAMPRVFGVTGRLLAEAAAAVPMLDYVEMPDIVRDLDVVDLPFGKEQPLVLSDRPDGTGLGIGLRLAPAVHLVTRRIEVPKVVRAAPTYGSLNANEFDIVPVKGFATYKWNIPLTNHLLERAALVRGLNTMRLWNGVFLADHAELGKPIGFAMRRSGWTGVSARRVADDKDLTRRMLNLAGVPTPQGAPFKSGEVEAAVSFAQSLDVPVVVKPRDGSHGIGVATNLKSAAEVRDAITASQETKFGGGRDFVVEEHITGNDYRVFVVGDRVVSVVHRRPAFVVGDGNLSVVDLVLEKNLSKLRNPHGCTRLIPLGRDAEAWLERQNLLATDVPEDGREVRLCSVANGSLGADPVEVLEETHPTMLELALRATRALPGLDHSGVDIIGDHRLSTEEQSARVIEVNTAPGTLLNHYPMFGPPRDVSAEIVLRSCQLRGFSPPMESPELSVSIDVFGVVQRVGYRRWFARIADKRHLVGSIRNQPDGSVRAYVSGDADDVAAMASRAFVGPSRAFVERVVTTHDDGVQPTDRFEVY